MSFSRLITILAIFMLILSGCGKKKQEEKVVEEIPAATQTEDTSDIFDEFYEDEETSESIKTEDESFSSDAPEFISDGRYVVQVSCVLSKELAQDVVRQLEEKGYPAYIAEVENPTTELLGVYHRIRIGGFTGVSKAKDFGDSFLSRDGYEYWVDNRSNDNVGIGGYGLGESSESSSYESSSYESSSSYDTDESATTDSYETSTEPATTESYESTTTEPATTEPAATESYETTTEPAATEPATATSSEPATTTEPATSSEGGDEWETSDDDWGSEGGDDWGSDTTSW